jgi:hypothetical protein
MRLSATENIFFRFRAVIAITPFEVAVHWDLHNQCMYVPLHALAITLIGRQSMSRLCPERPALSSPAFE